MQPVKKYAESFTQVLKKNTGMGLRICVPPRTPTGSSQLKRNIFIIQLYLL